MARNEPTLGDVKEDTVNPYMHSVPALECSPGRTRRRGEAVIITDIRIPFSSMVIFMVKWAIASIPTVLILMLIFSLVASVLSELFIRH